MRSFCFVRVQLSIFHHGAFRLVINFFFTMMRFISSQVCSSWLRYSVSSSKTLSLHEIAVGPPSSSPTLMPRPVHSYHPAHMPRPVHSYHPAHVPRPVHSLIQPCSHASNTSILRSLTKRWLLSICSWGNYIPLAAGAHQLALPRPRFPSWPPSGHMSLPSLYYPLNNTC